MSPCACRASAGASASGRASAGARRGLRARARAAAVHSAKGAGEVEWEQSAGGVVLPPYPHPAIVDAGKEAVRMTASPGAVSRRRNGAGTATRGESA